MFIVSYLEEKIFRIRKICFLEVLFISREVNFINYVEYIFMDYIDNDVDGFINF